jgi:DNA-binding beta-propeller fold protein YncE
MRSILAAGLPALIFVAFASATPFEGTVTWGNRGVIQRSNLDGSDLTTVASGFNNVGGIDLDLVHNKMYWTDTMGAVYRGNLDGAGVQVIAGSLNPTAIDLDLVNGFIVWTDFNDRKIFRANLDGTNANVLLDPARGLGQPRHVVLDPGGGKMYWTEDGFDKRVRRANLDGTQIDTLVTFGLSSDPTGLALDLQHGKMYWSDWGRHRLQRANLDGTGLETIIDLPDLALPQGIDLDVDDNRLYFGDNRNHTIGRVNLDGTDLQTVIAIPGNSPNPLDVAVIPVPEPASMFIFIAMSAMAAARRSLYGPDLSQVVAQPAEQRPHERWSSSRRQT